MIWKGGFNVFIESVWIYFIDWMFFNFFESFNSYFMVDVYEHFFIFVLGCALSGR